jgi:hypothetical protein
LKSILTPVVEDIPMSRSISNTSTNNIDSVGNITGVNTGSNATLSPGRPLSKLAVYRQSLPENQGNQVNQR